MGAHSPAAVPCAAQHALQPPGLTSNTSALKKCLHSPASLTRHACHAQLFRAPHGTPYIRGGADLPRVAGVVRRHAVNVVWTFAGTTTLDWDCGDSVQCVLDNYETFFSGGRSGIPLMHAVIGGTAGAAPRSCPVGFPVPGAYRKMHTGIIIVCCHLVPWRTRMTCMLSRWRIGDAFDGEHGLGVAMASLPCLRAALVQPGQSNAVGRGASGSPQRQQGGRVGAGALPQILQAGKAAGINFVSVDDFVREKYGMSAADVVSRVNSNCPNTYGSGSSSSSSSSSSGGGGGNGGGSNNRGGRRGGPGNPGGPGGPGSGGPGGPGDGGPGGPGDN